MRGLDWRPLHRAVKACTAVGCTPDLWWRDDDATRPGPALDRLAALADALGLPVHLAIIPKHATSALALWCADAPVVPVVHGWAHRDHSQGIGKKNEFQTQRADALADAHAGLQRMTALFGPTLHPMFVPPWNRISNTVTSGLHASGYRVLSTYGPRATVQNHGLLQVNTHVDPIDWKGTRDLIDPEMLILQAADRLHARAEGRTDGAEPFGLLSHHIVHTEDIWLFCQAFLNEMQLAGATLWQMEGTR